MKQAIVGRIPFRSRVPKAYTRSPERVREQSTGDVRGSACCVGARLSHIDTAELCGRFNAEQRERLQISRRLTEDTSHSPYISVMIRRNRAASSLERTPSLDPSRSLLIVRIWSTAISALRRPIRTCSRERHVG